MSIFDMAKNIKPVFKINEQLQQRPNLHSLAYKAHYDYDMLKKLVNEYPIMSAYNIPSNIMIDELKTRGYTVYKKRS